MSKMPEVVAEFLSGRRLVVAGVSRDGHQPANAIFRRLRDSGHEVLAVNPRATEVEGVRCFPDLASVGGPVDGLVVAVPPAAALDLVRAAGDRGIRRVWFHRSIGQGSVSEDAVRECAARGMTCIAGGCPLMYCEPVDPAHRCLRWVLRWFGRVPR